MSLFASIEDLIQTYAAQPKRFSWFLGAGASRTAGMPTASDLIWELKFRQYCRRENKNVNSHDWSNQTIRSRVQNYFDSKSAPENYAASEYSYYFKQEFGDDLSSQQKFIQEQFHPDKIALNIGQRALAAMMTMESANVVFTTNFDYVLETAVASVTGKSLTAFHLEGSYAALDALHLPPPAKSRRVKEVGHQGLKTPKWSAVRRPVLFTKAGTCPQGHR